MKKLVLVLAAMAVTSAAQAQSRPSTPAMTCRQAQGVVAGHGAIVLGTGGYTYDRFVSNLGFCEVGEYLDPAFVPTRDTPQCPVGYRCRSGPRDFDSGW